MLVAFASQRNFCKTPEDDSRDTNAFRSQRQRAEHPSHKYGELEDLHKDASTGCGDMTGSYLVWR